MVAIESDGDSRAEQPDYDRQRTARLNQVGIEVIRYANGNIMTNLSGVYEDLSRRIVKQADRERRKQTP